VTDLPALFILTVLFVASALPAGAQDVPSWTEEHGAFAFPDPSGTRILTTAALVRPERVRTAFCSGGRDVAVRFERIQGEGAVFLITTGAVDSGTTCLLAPEALAATISRIPLGPPAEGSRCSRLLYPLIQTDKGRPVVACWPAAESSGTVRIEIVEFARRLTHALASLLVLDEDKRIYVDYAAEFNGPGADLWRVDDGGEVHPEACEVMFLLKRGSEYLLALNWHGSEGSSLSLLSATDGTQFRAVINDFWYRSPI